MNIRTKKFLGVIFFIAICELAGVIGSLFTVSSISTWYEGISKPGFTPPGWLFGPVWTILYALMGVALYLLWSQKRNRKARVILIIFFFQLILNTVWSIIFFGLKNIGLALVDIVILDIMVIAIIVLAYKDNRLVSWLLSPYLAWILFASLLNFAIWKLN